MRILTPRGMIDIEAAGLLYCNIKRMYKSGHGYGLQLNEELEQARDKIKNACDKIADSIYELQDILEGYYKNISELERYYGDISEEPW